MTMIMQLKNVHKQYKDKKVLENISLSIFQGEIVALVGKNGSGKSTLLKIIGGLARADRGELKQCIQPLKIGYVPEVTPVDVRFTPEEYLLHMGTIRGMNQQQLRNRIDVLIHAFHLQNDVKTRMSHFSKGMKQKTMIMQAMLEETDLLILDEPLSGLDPTAQADLEQLLLTLKERGLSIILTCHETKLLENAVDRVLFIKDCQLVETNVAYEATEQMNQLIFEISIQQSCKELLPFIEITKQSSLNAKVNRIEAMLKEENTDKVIRALILKEASIKQLLPINTKKESFYQNF
ncbi:ABC transporter ATP-binding protein [Lysinibacillus sp. KU-BSD001]|uniref:ABC transporter ATP-binding protein n=1 Tax=Lysinibacillus sp. KU-BSD001 TaxID=3141328 RepID=UPI0036E81DAB